MESKQNPRSHLVSLCSTFPCFSSLSLSSNRHGLLLTLFFFSFYTLPLPLSNLLMLVRGRQGHEARKIKHFHQTTEQQQLKASRLICTVNLYIIQEADNWVPGAKGSTVGMFEKSYICNMLCCKVIYSFKNSPHARIPITSGGKR